MKRPCMYWQNELDPQENEWYKKGESRITQLFSTKHKSLQCVLFLMLP